jgi:EAL domain-containing protein (putative c-di-GMP-specific phosphodiesterase class I)
MHVAAARRLALENDLRRAIERDELSLVYQPIVSADGRVRAIEALARWRHGTLGPVEPSVFIPIAEQTGMMRELGTYFAHEACRALRPWRAKLPGLRLALNISAQQLDWDDLIPMLDRALDAAGLAHDALELEVTETVVMREVSRSAGILRELKERGAHISIDDFGTGYSSLAWLRDLPIDTIKVDRSFVAAMETDPESSIIVGSIISLGAAMSLDVVAEGVETEWQISELSVLGCRLFQGYAFSRPVPGERIPGVISALSSGDGRE